MGILFLLILSLIFNLLHILCPLLHHDTKLLSSLNEFDFRALLVSVLLQYIDCDILSILNLAQPAAVEFQPKPSGLHKILLLVLAPVENPPLPHSPDPPSSTWVNFHDSLFCSVAKICILFSALLHWCPCLRYSLKPIMNC